jgi:2-succinyl-6-hydroxy-2,4-cyclohexadiene-1-carboxylate synthase
LEKINIASLHGFLGVPADWDLLQSHFMVSSLAHRFDWWAVDYLKNTVLNATKAFDVWAANFNRKMQLRFAEGPRVLIGYSLGGRLALHALKADPALYDAVILISTNPGLLREKDRFERRLSDRQWAKKFLEKPWAELMTEWNAQNVFRDSLQEPARVESDYERAQLALALTEWSVADQQDLRSVVVENAAKILWLTGEKDIKYLSLAMEMKKAAPRLQTASLPRASHRVMFDDPAGTAALMIGFLQAHFAQKI